MGFGVRESGVWDARGHSEFRRVDSGSCLPFLGASGLTARDAAASIADQFSAQALPIQQNHRAPLLWRLFVLMMADISCVLEAGAPWQPDPAPGRGKRSL